MPLDAHAKFAAWILAHSKGKLTDDEIRHAIADMGTPEREHALAWFRARHERTVDTQELEAVKP